MFFPTADTPPPPYQTQNPSSPHCSVPDGPPRPQPTSRDSTPMETNMPATNPPEIRAAGKQFSVDNFKAVSSTGLLSAVRVWFVYKCNVPP